MCGIHLILDKHKKLNTPAAMEAMLQAGSHRGPDAQGYRHLQTAEQQLWMGGNRLQIIDPSPAANQPMQSEEGRYLLVYNGEIYNYYELRNQLLQEGERFITRSDTEVLLKLLIRDGRRALPKLNGMFAFAFYDREEDTMLAARDPFGMKPLYYYDDASYLILSSETQSLLASGLLVKALDEQQTDHYLRFKYAAPGSTFFKNVRALLPGQLLEKKGRQSIRMEIFHQKQAETLAPAADVVQETENLLTDAVLRHLSADVPCGLFLSGGVDSTLLLAIIQRQGAHPVPTFSVINQAAQRSFGTSDYLYAARAAQQYGSMHYELLLTPESVEEAWESFLQKTDQPVADSAALMTYMLSRESRKVAGVVLSGAGADEIFGGYHRHQAFHWYLKNYAWINKVGPLLRMSRHLPAGFAHPLRKQFRLLKKLGQNIGPDPTATFSRFTAMSMPFIRLSCHTERETRLPMDETQIEHYLQHALEQDTQNYLPQDVLHISDRMSMAQGLEMRMPYLDKPLCRFAQQLPATFRLQHGRKWILNRLLESYGGKVYSRRSKEGFGLPVGTWLQQPEYGFLRQPLEEADALLYQLVDYKKVQKMLQQQTAGKKDFGQELWGLITLSSFLTKHFK